MSALEELGIETRPMFTPLHKVGVYAGLQVHSCSNAEKMGHTGLALPSSIRLVEAEIERVVQGLLQARS